MRRPIEIGHLDTNGDWQRDRTDWRPRLERVVPSSFSTLTYVDETGELAALRADDFWRRRRLLRDISCVIPDAQVWNEHISAFKAGAA